MLCSEMVAVSKSMGITFPIFITAISHGSDILFKKLDGKHSVR